MKKGKMCEGEGETQMIFYYSPKTDKIFQMSLCSSKLQLKLGFNGNHSSR